MHARRPLPFLSPVQPAVGALARYTSLVVAQPIYYIVARVPSYNEIRKLLEPRAHSLSTRPTRAQLSTRPR